MLYIQTHTGRGVERAFVFSDTDNVRELDQFRCFARAPKGALQQNAPRLHLVLIGRPRLVAMNAIPAAMVFPTPADRMAWEVRQAHIMERHPKHFVGG
jgi:hypothetical protein